MLKFASLGASLLLAVATLSSSYGFAASFPNGEGREIIGRFDRVFNSMDSLIFGQNGPKNNIVTGGAITGFDSRETLIISPALDSALNANTAAKIHEGNGETGLSLTGQAYYRLAGNGGVDDVAGETGDALYRAKFQAELRWSLLQSSLFQKEGRRKVAELEERIARAGYEKEKIDINEFMIQNQIDQHYDSLMAGVLSHRVALLRLLDDAQRYLLANENISSDELVKVLNERLEAERKLSEIEHPYPAAPSLSGIEATTVHIDSAALIKHVASSQGDMKILQLRMELLSQKERNVKWWNNLNVAPFVRYAHYFRRNVPDTYNLDAGLAFTLPLNDQWRRKKRTILSDRAVLEAEQERLSRRVADKTAVVLAEVGRLDRASKSELIRMAELKQYIRQRTDAYHKGHGEHNRLARAREYAMYITCLERLIDYQYRRDCLVANLQSLLPDETILRFCSFSPLRESDINLTQKPIF